MGVYRIPLLISFPLEARVKIVQGDGSMAMSFLYYYESTQAMGYACGEMGMCGK